MVDKKPAVTRPLDEVRPQIEEQLKRQRADQQIADAGERARRAGSRTPADLDTRRRDEQA